MTLIQQCIWRAFIRTVVFNGRVKTTEWVYVLKRDATFKGIFFDCTCRVHCKKKRSKMIRSKRASNNELDETVIPDSTTTIEKDAIEFCINQDVFVKHRDGRFYLGTVVEVDRIREQCLVKFGDNTESWSGFKDLSKASTLEEEDLLCVICKKSAPKKKHEITVCDKCGRGYHQHCHQPEIPPACQKEGSTWMCKRCLDSEPVKQRKSFEYKQLRKDSLKKICASSQRTFPYDPATLDWDTYHRVNLEQIYCYCGGPGEWDLQMLQCARCKQWFHAKCVHCLQYPLYCGDRFYVFVCEICNLGKEFLRRLELTWVDLVHLMLFNLTAYNSKKYYDLDTVVIPYINDNWHALQLPPKMFNVSKPERRKNILSVLTNNRNRFKCGREIKKRTTIWGLRVRLPPPIPCITLPSVGQIVEDELRERWQGNRRLKFLPLSDSKGKKIEENKMIVPVDNEMSSIMMGTAYLESNASESDSPRQSPDRDQEENQIDVKLYKGDYQGAGCAKKSASYPKLNLELKRLYKRKCKEIKKVDENRKRFSLDSKTNKSELPLTPPTSVSAPPTPPASSSSNLTPDLMAEFDSLTNNLNKDIIYLNKISKANIDVHCTELNTPCSSGDETSSKSTLDLIIPPPKDFKGQNNPFLTLYKSNNDDQQNKKRKSKDITLPLPLTPVIHGRPVMRPTKRQLSEKDICIGPNGEVKRRRLRRSRSGQMTTHTQPAASKNATVVPARPDAKEWGPRTNFSNSSQQIIGNCVDYTFNGRTLRQRPDRNQDKEKTSNPPTPKPSPVKQEPDINMDDLKNSVNSYFGAATRIAAGERFSIKAKRISPNGNSQYLIEWEGPNNGMT